MVFNLEPISGVVDLGLGSNIFQADIQVSAPTGSELRGNTPIIVKLADLAVGLPGTIDPFGSNTPNSVLDDVKWEATFVYYDGSLIPSQVDDIDSIPFAYTENDELVFQIPKAVTILGESSLTFEVFFASVGVDLPIPSFNERVCDVYPYPKLDIVNQVHGWEGQPLMNEAYYIENEYIRACALVDCAWSSGGLYELAVLDENKNPTIDLIKQEFPFESKEWKWTRFSLVEQFIQNNPSAGVNPFSTQRIISGPVRAQIQMQSVGHYGNIPGINAYVTYELFASLPYLDYRLELVGPDSGNYDSLPLYYMNREWGGRAGSIYNQLYIPGAEWYNRNSYVEIPSSEFASSWFIESDISVSTGYGMLFDLQGLENLSYAPYSEAVLLNYTAAHFPFNTRFLPFNLDLLNGQVPIDYVDDHYTSVWVHTPAISISLQEIASFPYEYIGISEPLISSKWIFPGEILSITGVTAVSTTSGPLDGSFLGTHLFEIFDENNNLIFSGELSWDSFSSSWQALDIDFSNFPENCFFYAIATFEKTGSSYQSPPSTNFCIVSEIEQAVTKGIAWLVEQQYDDGSWDWGAGGTAFVLIKLQDRAFELGYDPFDTDAYEYAQNVIDGWQYLLNHVIQDDVYHGLSIANSTYETGISLMSFTASGMPNRKNMFGHDFNADGSADSFGEIAQEMVNWLAYAQIDAGPNPEPNPNQGGWGYEANEDGDNSVAGYAVLGLSAAEKFGCDIPDFVRDELDIWINNIQDPVDPDSPEGDDGGSWYNLPYTPWVNLLKTGNLIFQMTFYGDDPSTPRFVAAMDYIERHWHDTNLQPGWGYSSGTPAHYQAMYCLMKGLDFSEIDLINLNGEDSDWYREFAAVLVNQQQTEGSWPNSPCFVWPDEWGGGWGANSGEVLSTVWALLTLEKVSPPTVLPLYIDIKPSSWPNSLNTKNEGVIPVAICGSDDIDVMEIDPNTISLGITGIAERVNPLRWSYEDV
ncbi:MAG: hypothetical protein ACXACU_04745, partial [Candidatus Hodarchaeales archaeon]